MTAYCNDACPCETPCQGAQEESEFDRRARRERDALAAWSERGLEPTPNERRAVAAADYGDAAGCGEGAPKPRWSLMSDAEWARVLENEARGAALPASGEERIVDPTTGGVKGRKLARFDLLPADALNATAEHFGRGAAKYEDRNWERGYLWSLSFGAMQRHAWAYWGGEDVDEETGSLHLAAVAFHALALLAFQLRSVGTDDRAGA